MVVIAELERGEAPPEVVREIVRRLERGEILILPTDTVYGVHAHSRFPATIERVKRIKRITEKRPFVTLYSTVVDIGRWVLLPEGRDRRAVLDSWPGQVTWVLPARRTVPRELLGSERTLGIRVPSHPLLRAICTALDDLIISSSANLHGQQPAVSKEDFSDELLSEVDAVVYQTTPLSGRPSEVKRWTPTGPVVLRARPVENEELKENLNVLVICSGNTCRSPLAEGILTKSLQEEAPGKISVKSAGILALSGNRATLPAIEVAKKHEIDLTSHRSQTVSREKIEWADIILAMTTDHLGELSTMFPAHSGKMYLYSHFPESELDPDTKDYGIPDPYGLNTEAYQETFYKIKEHEDRIVSNLLNRVS